jgi:hypothetical protein
VHKQFEAARIGPDYGHSAKLELICVLISDTTLATIQQALVDVCGMPLFSNTGFTWVQAGFNGVAHYYFAAESFSQHARSTSVLLLLPAPVWHAFRLASRLLALGVTDTAAKTALGLPDSVRVERFPVAYQLVALLKSDSRFVRNAGHSVLRAWIRRLRITTSGAEELPDFEPSFAQLEQLRESMYPDVSDAPLSNDSSEQHSFLSMFHRPLVSFANLAVLSACPLLCLCIRAQT